MCNYRTAKPEIYLDFVINIKDALEYSVHPRNVFE